MNRCWHPFCSPTPTWEAGSFCSAWQHAYTMDCCSSESGQAQRHLEVGLSFCDLAVVRWYMLYRQLSAILVTISFACSSVAWYPICTLKFNGVSRPKQNKPIRDWGGGCKLVRFFGYLHWLNPPEKP